MLYKDYTIKLCGKKLSYLVERDELISENEVEELCEKLALCAALSSSDIDINDVLEIDIDSNSNDISEDEFAYRVLSRNCLLVDSWRSFGNLFEVFANVYQVFDEEVEGPICYSFEAECGQEPDVDTIGVVNEEHPREEVFETAWKDCLYQLRRYFKVSGWLLKSGIFRITRITVEDYEYMRKEREAILS